MPVAIPFIAAAAGAAIITTDVVLRAAAASGIRNYVTSIDIRNAHVTGPYSFSDATIFTDGTGLVVRAICCCKRGLT